MKALVLGAGGMAGHVITMYLKEQGHTVTGVARRNLAFCNTIIADITNITEVRNILDSGGFDAVINAVGILPGAINKNLSNGIWINSCFPHLLSDMTSDSKTRIIHLSTDCVFSGHDGGRYDEACFCSANDYYGRSKVLGELNDDKNLTFRMSIIGPDINRNGVGLFNWFMKQTGAVSGYQQAIWTGVTTITLAWAIDAALVQGLTGLFHLVNNTAISKYELLKLFNQLKAAPNLIKPDNHYHVDKSMISTRTDFQFVIPSYYEMTDSMAKWVATHKALYPHYQLREKRYEI